MNSHSSDLVRSKSVFLTFFSTIIALSGCTSRSYNSSEGVPRVATDAPYPEGKPARASSDVVLQMFNVPMPEITKALEQIASNGYGYVHVSPINLSSSRGKEWYWRYQPLDYRVIDGLGTENDLVALIAEARRLGVKIVVDVVLNHMANFGKDFDLIYPPKVEREKFGLGILFTSKNFHKPECITDWMDWPMIKRGRLCGGPGDSGLPDLDSDTPEVFEAQRAYLLKLARIGVDGFRFDAIKHMEPAYVKRLIDHVELKDKWMVGEVIAFDAAEVDPMVRPYVAALPSMRFYDFQRHSLMNDAFKESGRLANLASISERETGLPNERSVTFHVNHDLPQSGLFASRILPPPLDFLVDAYLLLRKDGQPYLYSDRGIADGLASDRWKDAYKNQEIAKIVRLRTRLAEATEEILTTPKDDSCTFAFQRGAHLVMLNKCAIAVSRSFSQKELQNKTLFMEILSGREVEVSKQSISFPAHSVSVLLPK